MHRICLFLLCLLSFIRPLQAVSIDAALSKGQHKQKQINIDTGKIILRSFDAAKLASYKEDAAFKYEEEQVPVGWWQHFKQWLYNQLARIFSNGQSGSTFKWLFIILGSAALLFLVYKIAGMDILYIFGRRNRVSGASSIAEEEDIHQIDFEMELQTAITNKNFRQAVRLSYLQLLKELTDRTLIDWQPGKTNQIYVQELGSRPFSNDFRNLTGLFEKVWYGAFPVRENDFFDFRRSFAKLKDRI